MEMSEGDMDDLIDCMEEEEEQLVSPPGHGGEVFASAPSHFPDSDEHVGDDEARDDDDKDTLMRGVDGSKQVVCGGGGGGDDDDDDIGTDNLAALQIPKDTAPKLDVLEINSNDYFSVTSTAQQKRAYVGVAAADDDASKRKTLGTLCKNQGRLLAKPVREMVEEAEQRAANKRRLREERMQHTTTSSSSPTDSLSSKLWVDKYRPRGYIELLSDEVANRDVLRWIKMWDACVFGRTPTTTGNKNSQVSTFGTRAHQNMMKAGSSSGGGGQQQYNQQPQTDEHGRPLKRILLIAGPPGFGKTTAAHVLAAHCGYRVVEINASDERTRDALSRRVTDAVQMQSVSADRRPNLVVLDEVDGAMGGEGSSAAGAVNEILRIANGNGGGGGKKRKGKGGGGGGGGMLLRRPIICICNDLYAPSLRQLREQAYVIKMGKPRPDRVADRVRSILGREGVRVESNTAVTGLVERCDCDVRSTVNALQLIMSKKQSEDGAQPMLRAADVTAMAGKDVQSTSFEVWDDVFHHATIVVGERRRNPITRAAIKAHKGAGPRFATVFDLHSAALHLAGGSDVVIAGVHENLSTAKAQDLYLKRYSYAIDSLAYGDMVSRLMFRSGSSPSFVLYPYTVLPVLCTRHAMGSVLQKSRIEYPRLGYVARESMRSRKTLLSSWYGGCPASTRVLNGAGGARAMCREMLPYLLHCIAPTAAQRRSVAFHSSDAESDALSNVVTAMLSYGLAYTNSKDDFQAQGMSALDRGRAMVQRMKSGGAMGGDEAGGLVLDPPVHHLCSFGDGQAEGAASSACTLTQATRQMISHELVQRRILMRGGAEGDVAAAAAMAKPSGLGHVAPSARAAAVAALESGVGAAKDKKESKKRAVNWLEALKVQAGSNKRARNNAKKQAPLGAVENKI
ncbi:hypothetical protein PPROV_001118500 [Pycnococcus provasolii]|uniref:AAA+ ATPase domain-containing protein n=1 Tax=Pycnococcus provasolii TaxID=41880 RepID=A0A830I5T9_9CHLO|nr:hypothetical protein PPROV_001118500 [Pycnococcus provasolii]